MKYPYLEVTFRNGKPLAAYYYLPRKPGDHSVRCEPHGQGMVVDYAPDDRPIGIELTAPALVNIAALNLVLARIHQPVASPTDLLPLIPHANAA